MENFKIIIYGDLHGCLEEFKELRTKVNPSSEDREIIVGDILDRGPHSNKLLKYIQEENIECVMGNHEYKYLKYKKHHDKHIEIGKTIPMKFTQDKQDIFNNMTEKDFKYLQSLPFYIKIDNLTILHAGIQNKIDLDNARKKDLERLTWMRKLDISQNLVSLNSEKEEDKWWSEYYDGNQGIIVYGHQPFDEVKIDKFAIGIDTGCVFGGNLTALVIQDTSRPMCSYSIVQIDAKKEYNSDKY